MNIKKYYNEAVTAVFILFPVSLVELFEVFIVFFVPLLIVLLVLLTTFFNSLVFFSFICDLKAFTFCFPLIKFCWVAFYDFLPMALLFLIPFLVA